ncbi:MAG: nuclear transport factor 2 family protein [Acidimicrobiales bacterium]
MAQPAEIVESFIAAWPEGDPAQLAAFFTEDATYHNIPMDPVVGREAILATFASFMAMADRIHFDTTHLVADGPLVMTERVDHFESADRTISLPVMGVFEIDGDLIKAWRDYFDLGQFTTQAGMG